MLSPVHLRTLTAVVRAGSFADAARQLGYTSSAVSQQVAALERAVQMRLFERDAHSIRPTPAGEFVAEHAHDVLAALVGLEDEIHGFSRGRTGRLRIGSFPTASERLLPAGLAEYRRSYPAVEVRLDEGEPSELIGLLRDGELDVAVVYRYDLVPQRWPSGLSRTALVDEQLLLLLPEVDAHAGTADVRLVDLAARTWVTTREGTSGATCLDRMCATAGFAPRVSVRSNDYDVIREFVRSGLGIALVPALAHVSTEGITTASAVGVDAQRHVIALHRPGGVNFTAPTAVEILAATAVQTAREFDGVQPA